MNEVLNFIKALNIKDEPLVIACSGGPDSMFLLHLLHELGYKCICAHVNHNVRDASKDEYIFLQNYCEERNIVFEGTIIDKLEDDNFHNAARNFRYNFFENILKKYKTHYLFTAHHGDDLIETILMRLVRGSSLKGYSGFESIVYRDGYQIIRPLIYLTKEEIEKYDKENDIEYVIDESNATDHYARNRYRHKVLPFLKSENPRVHHKFLEFSDNLSLCMDYLNKEVDKVFSDIYHNKTLNIVLFKEQHEALGREIINRIFKELYPDNLSNIDNNNVSLLLDLIRSDKANVSIMLPNNVVASKKYDNVIFSNGLEEKCEYNYIFDEEVITPLGCIKEVDNSTDTSNYTIRLNTKDIKLPLIVSNVNDGDRIKVKNLKGSKKVRDIFIDEKIDFDLRSKFPVLKDSDGVILWVPGLKKSDFDIPIDGLYDIILKYEKGEIGNE